MNQEYYVIVTEYPLSQFGVWDSIHDSYEHALQHIVDAYGPILNAEPERFREMVVQAGEGMFRIKKCGLYRGKL